MMLASKALVSKRAYARAPRLGDDVDRPPPPRAKLQTWKLCRSSVRVTTNSKSATVVSLRTLRQTKALLEDNAATCSRLWNDKQTRVLRAHDVDISACAHVTQEEVERPDTSPPIQ
jgi:hypothetical protein